MRVCWFEFTHTHMPPRHHHITSFTIPCIARRLSTNFSFIARIYVVLLPSPFHLSFCSVRSVQCTMCRWWIEDAEDDREERATERQRQGAHNRWYCTRNKCHCEKRREANRRLQLTKLRNSVSSSSSWIVCRRRRRCFCRGRHGVQCTAIVLGMLHRAHIATHSVYDFLLICHLFLIVCACVCVDVHIFDSLCSQIVAVVWCIVVADTYWRIDLRVGTTMPSPPQQTRKRSENRRRRQTYGVWGKKTESNFITPRYHHHHHQHRRPCMRCTIEYKLNCSLCFHCLAFAWNFNEKSGKVCLSPVTHVTHPWTATPSSPSMSNILFTFCIWWKWRKSN